MNLNIFINYDFIIGIINTLSAGLVSKGRPTSPIILDGSERVEHEPNDNLIHRNDPSEPPSVDKEDEYRGIVG